MKDKGSWGCAAAFFVGELMVGLFVLGLIIRAIPVLYVWTQPFFEWLGNLIKHL